MSKEAIELYEAVDKAYRPIVWGPADGATIRFYIGRLTMHGDAVRNMVRDAFTYELSKEPVMHRTKENYQAALDRTGAYLKQTPI